jgi:hypothetical protein
VAVVTHLVTRHVAVYRRRLELRVRLAIRQAVCFDGLTLLRICAGRDSAAQFGKSSFDRIIEVTTRVQHYPAHVCSGRCVGAVCRVIARSFVTANVVLRSVGIRRRRPCFTRLLFATGVIAAASHERHRGSAGEKEGTAETACIDEVRAAHGLTLHRSARLSNSNGAVDFRTSERSLDAQLKKQLFF